MRSGRGIVNFVIVVLRESCRNAISYEEPDTRSAQTPGHRRLLEVFAPVERVLHSFILLCHVLFDLRHGIGNGIPCFFHTALKFLLVSVFTVILVSKGARRPAANRLKRVGKLSFSFLRVKAVAVALVAVAAIAWISFRAIGHVAALE